jgi:hypothetical protein
LVSLAGGGGGVFISGKYLEAMNTRWFNCKAETGGGVAISDSGSGKLINCTFRKCGIGGRTKCPVYVKEDQVGGALALLKGSESESEGCNFTENEDGAVWMSGRGIFHDCIFANNLGYCGGLYVGGYYNCRLRLFVCYFEGNRGFSKGMHIYFETNVTFSASNCLFVLSRNASIFISESSHSIVNLSFICFRGLGFHLLLPHEEGIVNLNVKDLCFGSARDDSISGSFLKDTNCVRVYFNCKRCWGLNLLNKSSFSSDARHLMSSVSEITLSGSPVQLSSQSPTATSNSPWPALILGAVIGGLIVIAAVVVLVFLCFRRRRRDKALSNDGLICNVGMESMNLSKETECPVPIDSIDSTNDADYSSGLADGLEIEASRD